MLCDSCPKPTLKVSEIESGSISKGTMIFWLCDECLSSEEGKKNNDGAVFIKTGNVRVE